MPALSHFPSPKRLRRPVKFTQLISTRGFWITSPKKRKPKLNVLLDVYKVAEAGRQREFVRRLKQLGDEFNVPLSAPGDSNALATLIEELEQEQAKKAA